LNPSAYPVFLATEHINTSIGLPSIYVSFSLPQLVWLANPKAALSFSSVAASFLSILFPRMTTGTLDNSGVANNRSNSFLDSSNLV